MRKFLLIILILSGCKNNGTLNVTSTDSQNQAVTTSVSSTPSPEPTPTSTPSSTPVANQFLYVLAAGKVCAFPIDSTSKDIVQPSSGGWCVGASSNALFYYMVMDPSGNYLYASAPTQNAIYQYTITQDVTYVEYSTPIPLNAMSPSTVSVGSARTFMSFGSNGNLYIQNNNYSPSRLDKFALSSGALSYSSTVTASTEIASYGMTMAHVTSVSSGNETYTIDAGANQIVHYTDGVIQQSFQLLFSETINAIQLH